MRSPSFESSLTALVGSYSTCGLPSLLLKLTTSPVFTPLMLGTATTRSPFSFNVTRCSVMCSSPSCCLEVLVSHPRKRGSRGNPVKFFLPVVHRCFAGTPRPTSHRLG